MGKVRGANPALLFQGGPWTEALRVVGDAAEHCVQLLYNLSDMEDMLYEVESVRRFAGLRLSGPLPDETRY